MTNEDESCSVVTTSEDQKQFFYRATATERQQCSMSASAVQFSNEAQLIEEAQMQRMIVQQQYTEPDIQIINEMSEERSKTDDKYAPTEIEQDSLEQPPQHVQPQPA